jgi:hypothetical protein
MIRARGCDTASSVYQAKKEGHSVRASCFMISRILRRLHVLVACHNLVRNRLKLRYRKVLSGALIPRQSQSVVRRRATRR